ncbi:MAG: heme-binding protein [Neisseria sp.]|jgi:glc operon protein GlcG|nr:heme-binding protein [Neisseria sp.]
MKTKPILSEHETALMMTAAVAEAKKHGWPVAISIVDDGGHLLAMTRLDNTAPMNAVFSQEKAKTAAISGFESKLFEDIVASGRNAFLSAPLVTSLGGGLPVLVNGQIAGAIGASGVTAEQDMQVAKAGLAALTNV